MKNDQTSGQPRRVFLLGATGTIGRATLDALLRAGHEVTCFVRAPKNEFPPDVVQRCGDVTSPESLVNDGLRGDTFDVLITCLASRDGSPKDAWAIDHQAQVNAIEAAKAHGIRQVIFLSAICVQKPRLAFQHAKLAAEAALIQSGLRYSIVRPTAFFKSLSGQIARVQQGKPFLLFGDGQQTACKPISDADLADYLVGCIDNPDRQGRILPIGGPGPAITPCEQGAYLFDKLGKTPRYRSVPVGLIRAIAGALAFGGKLSQRLANAAEFARIAEYYATESMLVYDPDTEAYSADATPETGRDTLFAHYDAVLDGTTQVTRGDHSVF